MQVFMTGVEVQQSDKAEKDRITGVLARLAQEQGPDPTLGEVLRRLGKHAFGAAIVLFSAPNLIPLPPGSSSFLSLPLLFITAQLALGFDEIWLPHWLACRPVRRSLLRQVHEKVSPLLVKASSWTGPRAEFLLSRPAMRVMGLAAFVLAIVLVVPLPFLHQVPALALIVFAMAILWRDGYLAALGWGLFGLGILSVVLLTGFAASAAVSLGLFQRP